MRGWSPMKPILRWPCATRCATPSRAPPKLSESTASASIRPAGRSTNTVATPAFISGSRYRWSSPAGITISPSTRRAQKASTSSCSRSASSALEPLISSAPWARATSSIARLSGP